MIAAVEKTLGALAPADSDANPPWLMSIREAARGRASQTGFPTTRQEEWRFTNVAGLLELPLHAAGQNGRQVTAGEVEPHRFDLGGPCLVFIDGAFRAELSSLPKRGEGVEADSLRARLSGDASGLQEDLARHASYEANYFTALNTAYFRDGAFVSVPDAVSYEHPIQLLFVAASEKPGATTQIRNLILAGRQSALKVVETYVSLTGVAHVTNAVTELVLGPEARVEHCRLQNENPKAFHIATVQAVQAKGSQWISHSIATGGRVARNQIQALLNAPGAGAMLNGLFLGRDDQLIDHHTVVDHAMPNCESHEFYHGILADRSHGVFNGKIFVRQDAQKTNAKQTNRNLLLSDSAVIDTKPQLEIFADDVKCTHGATVGQLNDEALFYLQSRGISAAGARQMLVRAFAGSVVDRISMAPVRERLDRLLSERIENAQP